MIKHTYILGAIVLAAWQHSLAAKENIESLSPGLVATYQDDTRSISEIVALPELGLAAEESPHPGVKPIFNFSYKGFLKITQAGSYQFETQGALSIDGQPVASEIKLEAGNHAILLTHKRPPGDSRFGLSWQSEHFVKEPVPPIALWHKPLPPFPQNADGRFPSPSHRIRTALATLKCASCHDANFLETMHHKFAPNSLLTLMRHANTPKWYGSLTGPLLEENATLTQLAADLKKLPSSQRVRAAAAAEPNSAKNMVGTQKGLACIACHDLKHHKTEAESKGPNLALITERVSYDWFVRWMENPGRMKPGVPMPAFFAGQEPALRQKNIDALWDYFALGQQMELPDELHVNPNQFILKASNRPIYTRTYIRLPDGRELLRAICVGLPNGVSFCFDSETCQLAYVWTGGFLDMAPHWQNQSGMPTPVIGTPFFLQSSKEGLRIGDHKPVFTGYEIVGGIPRFEFTIGEAKVSLHIDAPSPDSIRQTFSISKLDKPIIFIAPKLESPLAMKASQGTWAENRLTIADTGNVEFTLTTEKKQ
ncbi:MAG: DUF6797 domain-containing protein [Akkermansiaceae bacterium]